MTMGGVVERRRRARLEQGTGVSFPSGVVLFTSPIETSHPRLCAIDFGIHRSTYPHAWMVMYNIWYVNSLLEP